MRLVSIGLNDIRRFSHPVRVDGIDAGLNVLSAPNESGKSSLFDALQALFFIRHGSSSKEIKALRPHAGGAPEVSAEIEAEDGRWRIVKRWLSRATAEVWKDGRLVAKGEEAEDWIARVSQGGADVGPAGLLWVRQGLTALDQGSPRDIEAAQAVRRDLMSSVTGEVELVTGGRRMDRALARAQEELGQYVTGKGQPRKGGPLYEAEEAVAELRAARDTLAETARRLRTALDRRHQVMRDLNKLREPDAVAERQRRLAEATAAREAAQRHAEAVDRARAAVTTARLQRERAVRDLAQLRQFRERLVHARHQQAEAAAQAEAMKAALHGSEQKLSAAKAVLETAQKMHADAEAVRLEVLKAAAHRGAEARRQELGEKIEVAVKLATDLAAARRAAVAGPDAKAIAVLEKLAQEISVLQTLRARSAARITMRYAGADAPRVTLSGAVIADGQSTPVLADSVLDLPGIGLLELHPSRTGDEEVRLADAESRLAAALASSGRASLDEARVAAQARIAAEARVAEMTGRLAALAPSGIDGLRAELAALPQEATPQAALPDLATAQAAVAQSAGRRSEAEAAVEMLRRQFDADRSAEARAAVTAETTTVALRTAEADLAACGDIEGRETELHGELESSDGQLSRTEAALGDLMAGSPDLDGCDAALARARSVCDLAESEIRGLSQEAARLDAEIELRAGSGVDEDLEDATLRLAGAEKRRQIIGFEVDVLRKLIETLEAARESARERYFEPVMVELKPLLRLLWPDAELTFDGDSLLPSALIRDGRREEIGTLSGGTQEQIALLVRLAFARLLAKGGRHAPVILDDALVYSDDDRIERMFDALHRQARDLQIIVLSCRQRAFRDLGGRKLSLEAATAP